MEAMHILALEETPKVGRKAVDKVLSIPDLSEPAKPSDLIKMLERAKEKFGRISVPDMEEATGAWTRAREIWDLSQKHNVKIISRDHPDYPKSLLGIPDPPALLHVLGNVDALNKDCIAIVGTREPTAYGLKAAKKLGSLFAENGYVVVSGLAEGIDSAAHRGALEACGLTVAVLAHGLDTVYPTQNKKLADEILGNNGAIVSEYPWGTKINRSFFVERDRIQSGLSLGVFVVETGVTGGTMHTVKFCKDQKRSLIVLKHPDAFIDEPKTSGNANLISGKQADVVFETEEDIDTIKQNMDRIKIDISSKHQADKLKLPGPIQTTLFS
jgi:DNA processing protein